jgi:plasmanylethanolamine desaturase
MTRHGFLALIGNSCLVLLPVAGTALAFPPFSRAIMATFAAGLFATNLFHKWTHDSAAHECVQWLQRCWLILPPAHHRRHHSTEIVDKNFAIHLPLIDWLFGTWTAGPMHAASQGIQYRRVFQSNSSAR